MDQPKFRSALSLSPSHLFVVDTPDTSIATLLFPGTATLDEPFMPELMDPDSDEYTAVAGLFCSQVGI